MTDFQFKQLCDLIFGLAFMVVAAWVAYLAFKDNEE